jgi:hypothetical protein
MYVLEDSLRVVYMRRRSLGIGKWFLVRWRRTVMSSDNARPSISLFLALAHTCWCFASRPAEAVCKWFTVVHREQCIELHGVS